MSQHTVARTVPAALVALIAIPLVAGSLRLLEIAGGPQLLPANPRVDASPAPLVLHVVGAAVYAVAGAFQFPARIRRRHRAWHRRTGRVLIGAGLAVAGSGLWMTLFCPGAPGGDLLWTVRLVVGSAVAVSLILGFTAIRRRDIARHRAWMIRAYALAVAAGHPNADSRRRRGPVRHHRAQHRTIGQRRLGDQRGRRRMDHPPTRNPAGTSSTSRGAGVMTMPTRYELRIDGHLDQHWSTWFGSLILTHEGDGTTTLRGAVTDQSELHGLLAKIRDLGLTLISVTSLE